MTRRITRRALLTSMAAGALATRLDAQGDVEAGTIAFPSGDVEIPAFLARPRAAGRHPGVIVVHDTRGLTDHVRDLARALAAERLVALAPDLRVRLQPGQPLMAADRGFPEELASRPIPRLARQIVVAGGARAAVRRPLTIRRCR